MSALDQLNPIEAQFVKAYAIPGDTIGNGTQAYLKANPKVGYDTASVQASRLLVKDKVRTSIQEIIAQLDIGDQVRLDRLKDITMHGKTSKVVIRDGEGNVRQEIEQPIKAADVCKAIDLINKMDGTYDRAALPAKLAETEYRALLKQQLKALRNERNVTPVEYQPVDTLPAPNQEPTANDKAASGEIMHDSASTQPEATSEPTEVSTTQALSGSEGSGGGVAGVSGLNLSGIPDNRDVKTLGGDALSDGGVRILEDETGYGGGI